RCPRGAEFSGPRSRGSAPPVPAAAGCCRGRARAGSGSRGARRCASAAARRSRRRRSSVSSFGGATAPGGAARLPTRGGRCGACRGAVLGPLVGRAVTLVVREVAGGVPPARGGRLLTGVVGRVPSGLLPAAL